MAGEEHWEFAVTIPAGTLKTAPVNTLTRLPPRRIAEISWIIPPGASGFTGFRITMNAQQVIPVNAGAWIVRDGSADGAALARLPDSGAWDVTGYNTGTFPHTVYVTFYADIIRPAPVRVIPFALDELQFGVTSPPAHRTAAQPS